jgi:hypothetical protein
VFVAAWNDNFLGAGGAQLFHHERAKKAMTACNYNATSFPKAHVPSIAGIFQIDWNGTLV